MAGKASGVIKRIFKVTGKVSAVILLLMVILILISYIHHRIRLSAESQTIVPRGRPVEVNAHMMNVYSEGEGAPTLVFMSGGGTCSPVLDFKTLYSELSDEYKIVVVEKAGYGFSEDVDLPRDIDSILSETRQALTLAGHKGPYILIPHSMSGIEALYWAQRYPDEVTAIIGLDMAVPQSYEELDINMSLMRATAFAAKVGLTRWIPGLAESDAIRHGRLSEEEKDLYRCIFYRGTQTTAMLNETAAIKSNAEQVAAGEAVAVPVLLFASNGSGTGFDEDAWRGFQADFAQSVPDGQMISLDAPHYIHNYKYEEIAEHIRIFISELEK